MKGYLADTHVLLWWAADHPSLSERHRQILGDGSNTVFVSAVSVWEVSIKAQTGKLSLPCAPLDFFARLIENAGFQPLPVQFEHAARVYFLPRLHNDPFDRLLISQACCEELCLLSEDEVFGGYELPGLIP